MTTFRTRRFLLFITALIIGTIYSALIPPFQSPDEYYHLKRSYSLLNGDLLLETPAGQSSGVSVDSGLLKYMDNHTYISHEKNTVSKKTDGMNKAIKWSKINVFSPAATTGMYFPVAYFPQATALAIGQQLNLSVDHSYRLARFFVLFFTVSIVFFSFSIFKTNYFSLFLICLPMTLFQMVSTSLDAFSMALAILCISLFMRGANTEYTFPAWMSALLALCILIVILCRSYLGFMIIFPVVISFVRKKYIYLCPFVCVLLFAVSWIVIATKTTHGGVRYTGALSTMEVTLSYLKNPVSLIKILSATFTNHQITSFYNRSFIGNLGWLDASFPPRFYHIANFVLVATACLSVSLKTIKADFISRISLVFVALSSTALIMLALLLTWTPQSATFIEGVQGRYFLIPMILFGYSLNGTKDIMKTKRALPAYSILFVWLSIVAYSMTRLMVERYYLSP